MHSFDTNGQLLQGKDYHTLCIDPYRMMSKCVLLPLERGLHNWSISCHHRNGTHEQPDLQKDARI